MKAGKPSPGTWAIAKHALHIDGKKRGCVVCHKRWAKNPSQPLGELPKDLWSDEHLHCEICFHKFSMVRRRHHCHFCGKSVCDHDSRFLTLEHMKAGKPSPGTWAIAKHALHIDGKKRGCVVCHKRWAKNPSQPHGELPKALWSDEHSHCEICFHKFSIVR